MSSLKQQTEFIVQCTQLHYTYRHYALHSYLLSKESHP